MLHDELVSTTEAAEILKLSTARIKILCSQSRFEGAEKIGRNWIIPRQSLLNYTHLKRGVKPKKSINKIKKF